MRDEIRVIERQSIRNLASVEENGVTYDLGEHRDFRRHPVLASLLPEQGRVSISWTKLNPLQRLEPHQHPTMSMIIVCKGQGRLIGDLQMDLKEGDIVVVPPGCTHGFVGSEAEDLRALSLQFEGEGLYENEKVPRVQFDGYSLSQLLEENQRRLESHVHTSFFRLLDDGTLENPACHSIFIRHLQSWSSKFQLILHARSAFAADSRFRSVFKKHFGEEFGHDELIKSNLDPIWDPVIEACSDWFLHQMTTASDAVRLAIIHLVLERSAHEFHERAARVMKSQKKYYSVHAEHDESHGKMGLHLLEQLDSRQLQSVKSSIEKAWQVLDTMLERIDRLVREA